MFGLGKDKVYISESLKGVLDESKLEAADIEDLSKTDKSNIPKCALVINDKTLFSSQNLLSFKANNKIAIFVIDMSNQKTLQFQFVDWIGKFPAGSILIFGNGTLKTIQFAAMNFFSFENNQLEIELAI